MKSVEYFDSIINIKKKNLKNGKSKSTNMKGYGIFFSKKKKERKGQTRDIAVKQGALALVKNRCPCALNK